VARPHEGAADPPAASNGATTDVGGIPQQAPTAIEVAWIPLGAGQVVVKLSGRLYEATLATIQRRPRLALYHSAIVVTGPSQRWVVEVAPSPDDREADRGVVGTGAVGTAWIGRFRLFRYEVRRWPGGDIPDLHFAVLTHRVEVDQGVADVLLALVPAVPTAVWGRDELGTGDMWNSNSVVAWLLDRAGLDADRLGPPPGGRAPGWDAGLAVARRDWSA
jgi:hypothetical protein